MILCIPLFYSIVFFKRKTLKKQRIFFKNYRFLVEIQGLGPIVACISDLKSDLHRYGQREKNN